MSYWGGWGFYPRHVTVEERKQKAKKQLAALVKKGMALDPVTIEGRTIAKSWWGAHWNRNLERYADYAYRLDRGRSYVRSGAVLDLKIKNGLIQAIVAGSGRKPYEVKITIKRLNPEKWKDLVEKTAGQIDSVSGLLEGVFPPELGDLFFAETKGLFPAPKEIRFDCSCPDFASLCKHTAAALYGTGARLDKQPALFFTLRDVKMKELVGKAAAHAVGRLLSKAAGADGSAVKKGRILELSGTGTGSISEMFGIAVDAPAGMEKREKGKPASMAARSARTAVRRPSRERKMKPKAHWEGIYRKKNHTEVSWYRRHLEPSLSLISKLGLNRKSQIIDVGGGASTFADDLVARGFRNVTILDISARSLEIAKQRLGKKAARVTWLEADVTKAKLPADHFDLWHDRAVFHFLTDAGDQQKYIQALKSSLKAGGHLIIAAFNLNGPVKCSGLEIVRYSSETLANELGSGFELAESFDEAHETPFKTLQNFVYCRFKKL